MTPDRREIWLRLAEAVLRSGALPHHALESADEVLRAMGERFGGSRDVERERDDAQADVVLLNGRVDALERELAEARAQLAGSVSAAELRHLLALCEAYARGDGDVTRDVLAALREFVAIVERRTGEQREGG